MSSQKKIRIIIISLIFLGITMILVVLNRNSRNLKEGEVDVNYADLYLKKHFLQQEIDNYDVYFTENTDKKNSLMKDMLDDFKITIQNDTKMSEEQINTIFKSYYEKVKENTTYKISKFLTHFYYFK